MKLIGSLDMELRENGVRGQFIDIVDRILCEEHSIRKRHIDEIVTEEINKITHNNNGYDEYRAHTISSAVTYALRELKNRGKAINEERGFWKRPSESTNFETIRNDSINIFGGTCPLCKRRYNKNINDVKLHTLMQDFVKIGKAKITHADIIRKYVEKRYKGTLEYLFEDVAIATGNRKIQACTVKNHYNENCNMSAEIYDAFCKVLKIEPDIDIINIALRHKEMLKPFFE